MAFTIAAGATAVVAGAGLAQIAYLTTSIANLTENLDRNHHPLHSDYEQNLTISEAFTLIWLEDGDIDSGLPLQRARQACLLCAEILDLIAQRKVKLEKLPSSKQKRLQEKQEKQTGTNSPRTPDQDNKGKVVVKVIDYAPTDTYLDKLLKKMSEKEKPQSLRKWILAEHMHGDWATPVLEQLTKKGVLEKEKKKFQLKNPQVREALRLRLRDVAFNKVQGTGNLYAILGVIYATDGFIGASLMPRLFSKEEIEHVKNNLDLLVVAKKT